IAAMYASSSFFLIRCRMRRKLDDGRLHSDGADSNLYFARFKNRADDRHQFAVEQTAARAFVLIIIRAVTVIETEEPSGATDFDMNPVVRIFYRIALLVIHADFKENQVFPVS